MTLWLAAGALTLALVALVVLPLVQGGRARRRLDYDLEVYRDQLAELARDRARGLVGDAEVSAARIEIQRRILAAEDAEKAAAAPAAARPRLALALALALGLPFAAGTVYLAVGRPDLPDQPLAARHELPRDPGFRQRYQALLAPVEAQPAALEPRVALADFLFEARQYARAAQHYRVALQLSGGRADIAGLYGEALVRAAGGQVGEEARRAFELALKSAPNDPRASYFLGLAEAQEGKAKAALERWARLEAAAPADAPWLAQLRREMERVAGESGLDLAALRRAAGVAGPGGGRGPLRAEIEAAERMSPEERMKMIRGMVEGLEARLKENPNDLEGWKRLGRAYTVLKDHAKAAEAWRRAAALAPGDAAVLADLAAALIQARPEGQELTPELVGVLRRLIAADPDNALALFYLGVAEAEAGNKDEARRLFTRLLQRLPADAPVRGIVERRLKALDG
jgi:cytochrome c-type biogenesis protein CcmH